MKRALQARLKKLQSLPRESQDLTGEKLEARIDEIVQSLGGRDAMLAMLDNGNPEYRKIGLEFREYEEMNAAVERARAYGEEVKAARERARACRRARRQPRSGRRQAGYAAVGARR
jgi:hypothetical protein